MLLTIVVKLSILDIFGSLGHLYEWRTDEEQRLPRDT